MKTFTERILSIDRQYALQKTPSEILAHQLCQSDTLHTIAQINDSDCMPTCDNNEIDDVKNVYSNLYPSEYIGNTPLIEEHHPPLPSILLANVQSLDNKVDEIKARVAFQRHLGL